MFSKILATVSLALALSGHVNGHALMTPALGVSGQGARSDVQLLQLAPVTGPSCGRMDVASNIDTSTPAVAGPDGSFTVTATNFNRRLDGSRQVTADVDPTGTGNNFNAKATVTQNGEKAPKELGSEQITAQLPAGMQCTGGASGNMCLVSFRSASGFGNCVVVQQSGAAGAAAAGNTATGAAAGTGAASTGTGVDTTGAAGTAATGAAAGTAATGTGVDTTGASTGTGVDATGASAGTGVDTTGASTGTGVDATGASAGTGVGATGASTGVGAAGNTATGASTGSAAGTAVGSTAGTAAAGSALQPAQAGTRAARALLAELMARDDNELDVEIAGIEKRALIDWIWA
ncbi:hypothetical protein VKT23_009551 [Stygiomarasmius scandens]|uniref:Uncharacterized protein n=1 Tax=Marasmiellus scandens TaxID=2682957 RepID=A0ABR1JGT0_9AGAR